MIAKTEAFSLTGLTGIPVTVEVDVLNLKSWGLRTTP